MRSIENAKRVPIEGWMFRIWRLGLRVGPINKELGICIAVIDTNNSTWRNLLWRFYWRTNRK